MADAGAFTTHTGYTPGLIGRIAELHARYYSEQWQFGRFFEAKVATEVSEFISRYDASLDCTWWLERDGRIEGSITIDGSGEEPGIGHLRWFIMSDALRGHGAGNHLMSLAMAFCDEVGFDSVYLWTFAGLNSARHLYDKHRFVLAESSPGEGWGTEVTEQRFVRTRAS